MPPTRNARLRHRQHRTQHMRQQQQSPSAVCAVCCEPEGPLARGVERRCPLPDSEGRCAATVCSGCAQRWSPDQHPRTPCCAMPSPHFRPERRTAEQLLAIHERDEDVSAEALRVYPPCPSCGTRVERIDGCPSITCGVCRCEFCFFCRLPRTRFTRDPCGICAIQAFFFMVYEVRASALAKHGATKPRFGLPHRPMYTSPCAASRRDAWFPGMIDALQSSTFCAEDWCQMAHRALRSEMTPRQMSIVFAGSDEAVRSFFGRERKWKEQAAGRFLLLRGAVRSWWPRRAGGEDPMDCLVRPDKVPFRPVDPATGDRPNPNAHCMWCTSWCYASSDRSRA